MEKVVICVDAIAEYEDSGLYVVLERLSTIPGIAFPGGKRDAQDRDLVAAIVREFKEETGLNFEPDSVLNTYGESDRDPRGRYISTVFVGTAWGNIVDEPGKTHVLLYDLRELVKLKDRFILDHFKMLTDYRVAMGI